jgi:hypothetical protein
MKPEQTGFGNEDTLADALKEYQAAARSSTARDEAFWENQRLSVASRMQRRGRSFHFRPLLAWAVAATVVMVVITLRVEEPRALPAPDFAGGYDQALLGDVERLVDGSMPSALEPAMILIDEIDAAKGESQGSGTRDRQGK